MKLIEIAKDKYINESAVCSMQALVHTHTHAEDRGWNQTRVRKVDETYTLKIWTADGVEHRVHPDFQDAVHDLLFPVT